jgi:hypothetical protein
MATIEDFASNEDELQVGLVVFTYIELHVT